MEFVALEKEILWLFLFESLWISFEYIWDIAVIEIW